MKEEKIILQKKKIDEELKNLAEVKKRSESNSSDEKLYEEILSFYSEIVILIDGAIKMT